MTRVRGMAYWPVTLALAALFAIPGAALVAHAPHFANEMARLGYPAYFLVLFGALKIAGAIAILAPRLPVLKEWAYAGMTFDVVGAIVSHLSMGDPPDNLILPALIGVLLFLSWLMRPAARRPGASLLPAA